MILRSLMKHVRDQNWVAVGLDFLIVVLGVFIGIQVANWNDARAGHQLGEDYVVSLVADLEKDLSGQRALSGYYTQVIASIEATDRLLSGTDPNPKQLVAAAYRASEFANDPTTRATWDQIVSSGHLGLLPGKAIASELSDFYKYQDSNNETTSLLQSSPYRLVVRSLIPLPVQLAIRDGCSDVVDEANVISGFVDECRVDVDEALLEQTAQTLLTSARIHETLRHQYSMVAAVRNNTDGNIVLIERIIDKLRADGER